MTGEKDLDRELQLLSEDVELEASKKRKPIKTVEDLQEAMASIMAGFDEVALSEEELERIRRAKMPDQPEEDE